MRVQGFVVTPTAACGSRCGRRPGRIASRERGWRASSRPRSLVLTGWRSVGCCHRARGRPRCAVPTMLGTLRRSAKEPGLPSPHATLGPRAGCLRSGSATGAADWCRVRHRASCRLLDAWIWVRQRCWRAARRGWGVRALRATRPIGAPWGRDRCRARSESSAVSVATATARCTASGVRAPDGLPHSRVRWGVCRTAARRPTRK
jgi:hypothetical protein